MIKKYFQILKTRNFSLLWFGQIISQFGDRLTQIALIGLVSKASMSSSSLAFIMSMAIIPVFLVSPIAGVYIDRWSKRKTMYLSDLIRGALIVLIPFIFLKSKSLALIYILIFFSFATGRFFIPAKMSFVPKIISKKDIFLANSLISITATIAAVFGIGLGGIIVEKYGITTVFIIDAFTFFISALAIFLISTREGGEFSAIDILGIGKDVVANVKKSFFHELREGLHYIFNSNETRYAFRIFLFLFSYVGGLYVVFIRFIQNALSSITKDLGFIAVSIGVGLFVGSLLYGRIANRLPIKKTINFAVLFSSFYLIFFVVFLRIFPVTIYAILFAFFLGLCITPAFIGVNALIHKESNEKLLGRIFSGLEFTSHLGFLVSMFLASILADIFSPFTVIISIGIIGFLFSSFLILKDSK